MSGPEVSRLICEHKAMSGEKDVWHMLSQEADTQMFLHAKGEPIEGSKSHNESQ